ncbi:heme NO-binding domain-containing protein [Anianabacter salinae]|uniref:heme NO-binding domain-containing protein n=1 Tax=Anianabacter salinae TaxID=2851023 RepID=UPI00225E34E2|nr:heme NO-binding domain-containing protein [Anianabacter salinae]MBV0911633.1 heme NO-binding domain-containing protein [Anianabacter salinae]
MHGLVNRSIQSFLTRTRGRSVWAAIAETAGLDEDGFDILEVYDDAVTWVMLDAAAARLGLPRDMLIEDVGTFIVAHPELGALRRLLRYGGPTYPDFLHALAGLPDRARLAVATLELPVIDVAEEAPSRFRLTLTGGPDGAGPFFLGILRAMADEYGVLAIVSLDQRGDRATLTVDIADLDFADARAFAMGAAQ